MKASTFLAVFTTALLSSATPVPEEHAEQTQQGQSGSGSYGPVDGDSYGPPSGNDDSYGPTAGNGGGYGSPGGRGGNGGGWGGPVGGPSVNWPRPGGYNIPPPGYGSPTGGRPSGPISFPGDFGFPVGGSGGIGGGSWGQGFGFGGIPIAGPPPGWTGSWPPCQSCFPKDNPLSNGGLQQASTTCSNTNSQSNTAVSCCPASGSGLLSLGCTLNIISDICSQKGASIACCPVTGNSAGPLTLINLGSACVPITL